MAADAQREFIFVREPRGRGTGGGAGGRGSRGRGGKGAQLSLTAPMLPGPEFKVGDDLALQIAIMA